MGLLDDFSAFVSTPEGQGLLSAAFGGMAGARKGQPWNTAGIAGMSGLHGYTSALDRNALINDKQADAEYKRALVTQGNAHADLFNQQVDLARKQQERQDAFIKRFNDLLTPSQQPPVMYQDKITPEQAGSVGLPTVAANAASPDNAESYFTTALKLTDPVQKQAVIEAGLRQWPQYRQALTQQPVSGGPDLPAKFALLGAQAGLAGIKGGSELIAAGKELDAKKREGGSTYIDPITQKETYYAKLPEGMEKVGGVVQNLRGYTAALGQQEGAKTGAQESAKAPYADPVTLKGAGAGGSDVIVPRVDVPKLGGQIPTMSPSDVDYSKEQAKIASEQMKGIQTAGMQAPGKIAKYQELGKLLDGFEGGTLSKAGMHIAQTANSLGISIDKNLPNKEAAASLSNQLALSLRSTANGEGMPGAMSDADRNFLTSSVPNLSQTSEGRRKMVDMQVAIHQREQDVAEMARKWQQRYGRIDAVNPETKKGFFDNLNEWTASHPLFGGK